MTQSLCVITSNAASSKDIREFHYSPIEFCLHIVWFYQLRHYRWHVCLRALKRKYILSNLHFIVDEKVKILHFHDEDKSWSSILYNSVANANLIFAIYILWFWYSQNLSLIVLSYKPLILWFLIDFFCYLRRVLCLKWS